MDIQITKYNDYRIIAVYTGEFYTVTGVGVTIAQAIDDALLQYNKTRARFDRLGDT